MFSGLSGIMTVISLVEFCGPMSFVVDVESPVLHCVSVIMTHKYLTNSLLSRGVH